MKKIFLTLLGALLLPTLAHAQTGSASDKIAWTQMAADLATAQGYTYRHYDDVSATGVVLAPVVCANQVPPVASVFDCAAPLPAFVTGAHTTALTAGTTVAGQPVESLKSTPLTFTFVVIPPAPTGVHIVKGDDEDEE